MDVLYANCAGLDIHKDTVVACSRRMIDGKVVREVRTFCRSGLDRSAPRTSRWKQPASTGSRSGTS